MSLSKCCKSTAGTSPTAPKSHRTQRRPVKAATLPGHPYKVVATNFPRRRFLHMAAGAAALPGFLRTGWAQNYPSRPITIIAPFPAGGPTDTIARLLAERIRLLLRQTVIIENVTGATGIIGVNRAAHATPDGYTLSIGTVATHVFSAAINTVQYDALTDFAPLSLLATQPVLIVGKRGLPATDLKELILWLKANPGKALEGTAGTGSSQHIGGLLFQKITGTRFQFVPYRGAAPAMQDLLAGQIDLMIGDTSASSLAQIRAGSIKAYAVMGETRLAAAPEIPTVDEAGLPGCYLSFWQGLWAPKGTPLNVIGRLNAAVADALGDPEVRLRFADLGVDIPPREQQTPEALGAFHRAEIEKWWPIIKAANINGE
jgi:tripartite-type tricarboxylate transporter receptor subunit TctC